MLNPTSLLADALGRNLAETYARTFGTREPQYAAALDEAARLVTERIASSDALYHDAQHTALVALCVQDILRGRRLEKIVSPEDWVHCMLAALTHDIGYVRGLLVEDDEDGFVIDVSGTRVSLPRGASDASLMPYHVDRSKLYMQRRLEGFEVFNRERILSAIEGTRFPPREGQEYDAEASLLRAADFIGQLGDPNYIRKANALYYEFEEVGINRQLGYDSPADIVNRYPQFYWNSVAPHIQTEIGYLNKTSSGRQWIANLYANVFRAEQEIKLSGPQH